MCFNLYYVFLLILILEICRYVCCHYAIDSEEGGTCSEGPNTCWGSTLFQQASAKDGPTMMSMGDLTTTWIAIFTCLLLLTVNGEESKAETHDHLTQLGQFPSWVKPGDIKLLHANGVHVDAVVAADGTGNFNKVMDAVHAAPDNSSDRYVIYIKRGVYMEHVEVNENKQNLMMIGDGMDATIISGNLNTRQSNLSTYDTATFDVKGKGFIARDISFENTAGPENNQAVALMSYSDHSVFYRCGIFGYQDSLCANINSQFYRECKISGTVDFIFGYAAAVFQNCQILVRKGLPDQKNTITAHGGPADPIQPYGFSFQFCNISVDSDLLPVINSTQTFLGRPWKAYSKVVFMQSYISGVLSPEGWLEWNGFQYLDTLYYAEYKNSGPGARLQNRVKWSGYHVLNDSSQANNFTVSQFISGDLWLPSTNVPFTPGLGDQNST